MHILDDWVDENLSHITGVKPKPGRPARVGIAMFKNQDPQPEIESPYRRKKKGGLQKLDFSSGKLNSCEQVGETKALQGKLLA